MSERPIRVGVDVTPLIGPATGIARFTRHVVDGLRTDPRLAVSGYTLTGRGRAPELPVPVHRSRIPAALAHRSWLRIDRPTGPQVAGDVDVVHATNYVAPPLPALVTVHDTGPFTRPDLCSPDVARFARLVARAVDRGAWIHVPSRHVADALAEVLPRARERISVVAEGLEPVPPAEAGAGRTLVGADRYVLALGTTEPRKNLPSLVRVFAAVAPPEVTLVVAGPPGSDDRAVADEVREHGLGSRLCRLPEVRDDDRAALIRDAELLVYPSLEEGFGFPPLEALSVGVPVVAAATGALPELVGDLVPLVTPGDPVELAELLSESLRDRPSVPSGVQDVIAGLDWTETGRRLADLLVRVALD